MCEQRKFKVVFVLKSDAEDSGLSSCINQEIAVCTEKGLRSVVLSGECCAVTSSADVNQLPRAERGVGAAGAISSVTSQLPKHLHSSQEVVLASGRRGFVR